MKIDHLKGWLNLKFFLTYRKSPLPTLMNLHQKHGHRIFWKIVGKRIWLFTHPQDINWILKDAPELFNKGRTTQELKVIIGNGLITAEGEEWKNHQKLMRPVFTLKNIQTLAETMKRIVEQSLQEIREKKTFDVYLWMNELTVSIIGQTLLGLDKNYNLEEFRRDVNFLASFILYRTRGIIKVPYWIPTARNKKFHDTKRRIDLMIQNIMDERWALNKEENLTDILLNIHRQDPQFTKKQVHDELMTILMAGHETIMNTLSWAFILLAQHPQHIPRLRNEAQTFWQNGELHFAELQKINFTHAFIEETMRLCPPVWVFMRTPHQEIKHGNLHLKKDDIVILSPYMTHHCPVFWKDPTEFLPDRFLGEARTKIIAGSYFPFGLGPRMCIGQMFAMVEAKIILSLFIKNFDFEFYEPYQKQEYLAGITLSPINNRKMKVSPL